MPPLITLKIDAKDIIAGVEEVKELIQVANRFAVARIAENLRSIVIGSFENAMQQAGEGFPSVYRDHLRIGIMKVLPEVIATGDGIEARYYGIESLGDYQTLSEGFHYHAILKTPTNQFSVSNPPYSELPWGGNEGVLENDKADRYKAWQQIVAGEPMEATYGLQGVTPVHTQTFQTTGLYEETLRARVAWWGDRYPEWLLLEYGQSDEPSSPPTFFKSFTEQRVSEYLNAEYEQIFDAIVAIWNKNQLSSLKGVKIGAGGREQGFGAGGRYI